MTETSVDTPGCVSTVRAHLARLRRTLVRPSRVAALAGAAYAIAFGLQWLVGDLRDGVVGIELAVSPAWIVFVIALVLPGRVATAISVIAAAALAAIAILTPDTRGIVIFPFLAVGMLAYTLALRRHHALLAAWGLAVTAWGLLLERISPGAPGMTIQGIVPVFVVLGAAGWAVGVTLRRRQAAEQDLALLAERRRRERVGLARELHDSVARDLTIIAMQSAVMRRTDDPDDLEYARSAIEETSRSALDDLKRLLAVLRAEDAVNDPDLIRDLDAESLSRATEAAARHLVMLGFQVNTHVPDDELPRATEATAVRVLREGTTNITKHTGPGALCSLDSRVVGADLVVTITNDLRAQQERPVPSTQLGIATLSERLRLLAGTLTAGRDGARWVLTARIPLEPPLAGSSSRPPPRRRARVD